MDKENFFETFIGLLQRIMNNPTHDQLSNSSKGEIALMIYISNHDNVSPGQLSEVLKVGSGRVANALKNLEKKDYIIRKNANDDHRKTIIFLTEKGKNFVTKSKEEGRKNIFSIYDALGEEDSEHLLRIIEKLINAKEGSNV